ncbi:MAG: hypothetical protein V1757_09010 [Actinomycetota bacterium]
MRTKHHEMGDPIGAWAGDLRSELIHRLQPETVSAVAAAIASSGAVFATTTVATLVATGGGAAMTTATIGATTSAHAGAKIAAGCLAAALTAGGTLTATGHLPDGAQGFTADAAAHVGIRLPRPAVDATVDLSGKAAVSQLISVGAAGEVGVRLDANGLNLTAVDANAGYTANVVAETADAIIVEFQSAEQASSVLVSNVDGAITASVTGDAASNDAETEGGATVQTDGQADLDADGSSTSFDGSTDANLGITLGG